MYFHNPKKIIMNIKESIFQQRYTAGNPFPNKKKKPQGIHFPTKNNQQGIYFPS